VLHITLAMFPNTHVHISPSLVPRFSPRMMVMKRKEGESLVPLCLWCMARWHHWYNELICYTLAAIDQ